jgi:hypothetical protein
LAICSGRKRFLRSFQAWTRQVASWGLEAEGALEAVDEIGDALEALSYGGPRSEETLRSCHGRRQSCEICDSLSNQEAQMALGSNLIAKGLLTQERLDKALEEQKKTPGVKIGEILVRMGMATKEQVEANL